MSRDGRRETAGRSPAALYAQYPFAAQQVAEALSECEVGVETRPRCEACDQPDAGSGWRRHCPPRSYGELHWPIRPLCRQRCLPLTGRSSVMVGSRLSLGRLWRTGLRLRHSPDLALDLKVALLGHGRPTPGCPA